MGSPNGSTKRPLISVQDKDPFAAAREAQTNDLTYLQGYSNKRMQIDDDERRNRAPSVQLSHRFHYVTDKKPSGIPDGRKLTSFKAQGYRMVKWDEAANLGIEVPLHAEQTVDGGIRVGDTVLMVCSAENAAKLEAQGRSAIDEKTSADYTASPMQSAAREVGSVGQGNVTSTVEQRTDITKG